MKKSKWIYFIPLLYLVAAYGFFFFLGSLKNTYYFKVFAVCMPFIMGIINLIIVLTIGRKWPRKILLNCALLIKYGLLPFNLTGGVLVCSFMFLTVRLLPLLGLLFGVASMVLLVYFYGVLLGSAPYSMAYIIKSYKEGVNSIAVAIISGICQFIFCLDVLSMMILTLKEKNLVKTTIIILTVTVLFGALIGTFLFKAFMSF